MTSDQNNTLVTVQQFAALHGVSPVTVRLWISTGRLPGAQKLGRDWLIPGDAVRPTDGRTTRRLSRHPARAHDSGICSP